MHNTTYDGEDNGWITVDPNNRLHRYSDPTEQWELIDPPDQQVEEPRGFTAMDRRSQAGQQDATYDDSKEGT